MSYGKMNTFIEITSAEPVKDAEDLWKQGNTVLASVRAFFEQKNSSEKWRNMSQISEIDALFRFRRIPNLELSPRHMIVCQGKRYNIYSVENIKNRKMYLEVWAVSMDGEN